uniref:Uncharacterized protein n=1 Tax=Nelumbo nucifera TaxID=4432 RepID=A0A822YY60_NELNU|nr:TPA_asm: hypothetical protein HUJ06_006765 [Nelumbo nucifera]
MYFVEIMVEREREPCLYRNCDREREREVFFCKIRTIHVLLSP